MSISIGVDILCHACEIGRRYATSDIKITDKQLFVDSIIRQLESECTDGTTLIHAMLDKAVTEMLENGELGVDELEYE